MRIKLEPEANIELEMATAKYEAERIGLGGEFADAQIPGHPGV